MKPEDWRKGMENEAASVEDEGWARETRRHVLFSRRRALFMDCLFAVLAVSILAAVLVCLIVLIARYTWNMDQNVIGKWMSVNMLRFDFTLIVLEIMLVVGLGLRGIRPKYAALSLATLPLVLWLIGKLLYVEGVWDDPTIKLDKHITQDFVEYPLTFDKLLMATWHAFIGFTSAWVGNAIRHRRERSRHRQFDHPSPPPPAVR